MKFILYCSSNLVLYVLVFCELGTNIKNKKVRLRSIIYIEMTHMNLTLSLKTWGFIFILYWSISHELKICRTSFDVQFAGFCFICNCTAFEIQIQGYFWTPPYIRTWTYLDIEDKNKNYILIRELKLKCIFFLLYKIQVLQFITFLSLKNRKHFK